LTVSINSNSSAGEKHPEIALQSVFKLKVKKCSRKKMKAHPDATRSSNVTFGLLSSSSVALPFLWSMSVYPNAGKDEISPI
jgi:hypothetical protein